MSDFQQILAALDEPVLKLDLDGVVVFSTHAAASWTGREQDYRLTEALAGNDRTRFEQALKRIADGKTSSTHVELTLLSPEGEATPIEMKLAAISGGTGKAAFVAAWLRDLSLEKANEAAATVQGTHLLDLVEHVTDACVIESADGGVEMLNQSFCDLFAIQLAPQSLVGTPCDELFEKASSVTQKRLGPIYFPLDSSADQGADTLTFALQDGAAIEQTSIAVSTGAGVAGRLHLFHRAASLPNASAADSSKPSAGALAAQMPLVERIARDLVVTVEGASNAILRAEQMDLPSRVVDQLRRIETSATSAFTSIAGLLDFSRIEGGELDLDVAPFKLRENLAGMLDRVVPLAERTNTQFGLRVEQDVPDTLIGDGPRLLLCLRNLIDCGFAELFAQSISGGEMRVTVEPEYSADQQIHLSFTVESSLPKGMTHSKTPTAAAQMQLALSRQIVRAISMGKNKLEVRDRKETLTFQFTAAFAFLNERDSRVRPTFVTLTGMPAMIVSADSDERRALSETMKSWRMHPREADNAGVALQLLMRMAEEEHLIPLVITSNKLPVQDGFLLGFRIRYHPKLKQTAVIMLSKGGKPGDAIACRESGISAYLRQPIADVSLNEAITAVMGTQDDSEATATLITRHSLREAKVGTVLIVDSKRDSAAQAVAQLRKKDFRAVLVGDLALAAEALLTEPFDIIVVDTSGLDAPVGDDMPTYLRAMHKHPTVSPKIVLAGETPRASTDDGYDAFVLKPYTRDSLVNSLTALVEKPEK